MMISLIVDGVKTYLKHRHERKQREHERDLTVISNQARLAADTRSNNHAWEMAALQDKDSWLRRISYSMLSAPILVAFVSPDVAKDIFEGLKQVPDWWVKTWVAANGAVWGISKLKEPIAQILSAVRK